VAAGEKDLIKRDQKMFEKIRSLFRRKNKEGASKLTKNEGRLNKILGELDKESEKLREMIVNLHNKYKTSDRDRQGMFSGLGINRLKEVLTDKERKQLEQAEKKVDDKWGERNILFRSDPELAERMRQRSQRQ